MKLETRRKISKTLMGHVGCFRGLTKYNCLALKRISDKNRGQKRSAETCRNLSLGQKNRVGWDTPEIRRKISESVKRVWEDPIERAIYQSAALKKKWIKGIRYKNVWLRSSYELIVAEYLDFLNLRWKYEKVVVDYFDSDGLLHKWLVDFYVEDSDLRYCIEVKGWVKNRDVRKWAAFHKQYPNFGLLILVQKDVEKIKLMKMI